jgi:ubiquinone/menaquinone biosynthesis C-methylase UbiE
LEPNFYDRIFLLQKSHWWYKSRERFLNALLRDLPGGGAVLDAGCGPGSMLHYFGRYGEVVGLDSYQPALQMCRSHFHGPLIQGECGRLPFADNSFTLVAACEVLYHRNILDVAATVQEFARVLQPGGALLLVDSAYAGCYSAHDVTAHGARRFTRAELASVMRSAGLEVVRATYAYALLLPPVWLLRRLKSLLGVTDKPGGELRETWSWLNSLVVLWFTFEAALAIRWGLAFGLSIQVLGRKRFVQGDGSMVGQ